LAFVVTKCLRCGRFLLSRAEVKTKTCPYCNVRFSLDRALIVATAKSAQEGRQTLTELKRSRSKASSNQAKFLTKPTSRNSETT
jgi:hypothetical protein